MNTCRDNPSHIWVADIPYCPYCNISREARVWYAMKEREKAATSKRAKKAVNGKRVA